MMDQKEGIDPFSEINPGMREKLRDFMKMFYHYADRDEIKKYMDDPIRDVPHETEWGNTNYKITKNPHVVNYIGMQYFLFPNLFGLKTHLDVQEQSLMQDSDVL